MGDVVYANIATILDIDPDRVLEAAKGSLSHVVVVGWNHDGNEYVASSTATGGDVLWLLEKAKQIVLDQPYKANRWTGQTPPNSAS